MLLSTLFEEDSGDDRPLKKTRMQSKYIEPATVGTSSNQRKSARGEKLPSSTGSTGGNEAEEIATDQGQQLETVNLAYDVPGPSKRIKWPSKRIREMHDKNVSSLSQLVYLGIEDDLFISSSAVIRKRIGFTCEMIFERVARLVRILSRCHTWYHNGCVGIQLGDVRLKETEIFACPPCLAGQ